ncbi:mannose-1-phosphate guanylyltransferase [Marinomonas gallaica]|uniref:mannose-1-phosphate guanylyltransferase n=1 Tax=Marinomonas gallaica TaxID=1806667 RepID=UPI003CE57753
MNAPDQPIIPVLLSGGVGSRLWPLSCPAHPKPFLTLPDGDSLLVKTLQRALLIQPNAHLMNVTNRELYFQTKDTVRKVVDVVPDTDGQQHYVLEPCARNTAAAIVASALRVQALYSDQAVMLVMPSDHLIEHEASFSEAVRIAYDLATEGQLVAFGIPPKSAEVGFGYIKAAVATGSPFSAVERFVEKPDLPTAQAYVASGEYLWNAGIFCLTPSTLLSEMQRYAPELVEAVQCAVRQGESGHSATGSCLELDAGAFTQVPSISIDHALFEHTDKSCVVPCDLGWRDIGTWQAWANLWEADAQGNQVHGQVQLLDTHNTFIHSPNALTAAVGVKDLIIVNTDEALLIAHKDAQPALGQLLTQLTHKRS